MIQIDISGPAGNAFALLGAARMYARQLGLDDDAIIKEMTEGDYQHLCDVFTKHFGSVVELVGNTEDDDNEYDGEDDE